MWASREMLKDNKDAQLYVKTTLRELFLYCIFLFIVCYMTFTQYSPLNYRYTQMMRSLFENQEDITNYKGFWKVCNLYYFMESSKCVITFVSHLKKIMLDIEIFTRKVGKYVG